MTGGRRLWLGFAVAAAAILGAVGGLSWMALDLEAQAVRQERLRLALWRLDTHVNPVIYRLASLEYSHYAPAFAPSRLTDLKGRPLERPLVLQPSPILTHPWPAWVRLHFQAPLGGGISSPQVPGPVPRPRSGGGGRALGRSPPINRADLLRALGRRLTPVRRRRLALAARTQSPGFPRPATGPAPPVRVARAQPPRQPPNQDWSVRNDNQLDAQQQFIPVNPAESLGNVDYNWFARPAGSRTGRVPVTLTPVRAAWLPRAEAPDAQLLLYRLAEVRGRRTLQGALLDWPVLRTELARKIGGLLPSFSLRPREGGQSAPSLEDPGRMTSLPVELEMRGRVAPAALLSPAWTALLVAAFATLLALVAAAWAVRRVVELGQRRMDLVNAVSHELRAPLTALRVYLDLLADDQVEEPSRRREILATLNGQTRRLSDLVRDVLDYARLERRTFVATREEVEVAALFADLADHAWERCAAAGLDLEEGSAVPAGTVVSTDLTAVRQIVLNLVDNACKSGAAADDPRVHLYARLEDGALVLEVGDHGPGIPARARRRLFQPFYRAEREMTREQPGVGLGLALARRFARAIGARLELVGDKRADGTLEAVFALRLPR